MATAKLTKRQQNVLKKHSEHHSAKHMAEMRKAMREGSTFTAAHNKAKKRLVISCLLYTSDAADE